MRKVAVLVALLGLPVLAGCAAPAVGPQTALDASLIYLAGQTQPDGTYAPSLAPYLVEVAAVAGRDPAAWPPSHAAIKDVQVPDNGSFITLLRPIYALGLSGTGDAGNLSARLLAGFDGTQFGDPVLLNDDAFALLALHALAVHEDETAIDNDTAFLLLNENWTGGWSYAVDGKPSVDMTGIVLAGLDAVDRVSHVDRPQALAFLASAQARKGGFGESAGAAPNCDSTVWGLRAQALLAQEHRRADWAYLLSLRQGDGGFAYQAGQKSNALCTAEVATLIGLGLQGDVDLSAWPA